MDDNNKPQFTQFEAEMIRQLQGLNTKMDSLLGQNGSDGIVAELKRADDSNYRFIIKVAVGLLILAMFTLGPQAPKLIAAILK